MIQKNFEKWNQITVGDCLAFPVNLRSMLSRDKLSTFDSSQNHHQGIHYCTTPKETGSVSPAIGAGFLFRKR